jgi:hypothetical protein
MPVSKTDLKTVTDVIGTTVTSLGLGAVPTNMRRWVTFIRADNLYGGQNNLYTVSTTGETVASTLTLASAGAKNRMLLQNGEHRSLPESGVGDPEVPLFNIAEDKYLTLLTDRGDVAVTIQYFDE